MPTPATNNTTRNGKALFCSNLSKYYRLPASQKSGFLHTQEAKELLQALPWDISQPLVEHFLAGKPLSGDSGSLVIDYFNAHSDIVPALTAYPATYTVLEKMYCFEPITWPIDIFFSRSKPGGVALKSRYNKVNEMVSRHIKEVLEHQSNCIVLDLGSGPGRNGIELTIKNPEFANRVEFHCVDTDPAAINHGVMLVEKHGLNNIKFVEKSMSRLHESYSGHADYGLIIGVLCGLTPYQETGLLTNVKPYFRKGARVLGAVLLESMLQQDLFCSYILRETAGWELQYPPIGTVKEAYENAGYFYEGYEQEEPTKCYEIGIGVV